MNYEYWSAVEVTIKKIREWFIRVSAGWLVGYVDTQPRLLNPWSISMIHYFTTIMPATGMEFWRLNDFHFLMPSQVYHTKFVEPKTDNRNPLEYQRRSETGNRILLARPFSEFFQWIKAPSPAVDVHQLACFPRVAYKVRWLHLARAYRPVHR